MYVHVNSLRRLKNSKYVYLEQISQYMKPKWTELKEETNTQIPLSVFHRTSRQSIRKNPEDLPKSFSDPPRSICQDSVQNESDFCGEGIGEGRCIQTMALD